MCRQGAKLAPGATQLCWLRKAPLSGVKSPSARCCPPAAPGAAPRPPSRTSHSLGGRRSLPRASRKASRTAMWCAALQGGAGAGWGGGYRGVCSACAASAVDTLWPSGGVTGNPAAGLTRRGRRRTHGARIAQRWLLFQGQSWEGSEQGGRADAGRAGHQQRYIPRRQQRGFRHTSLQECCSLIPPLLFLSPVCCSSSASLASRSATSGRTGGGRGTEAPAPAGWLLDASPLLLNRRHCCRGQCRLPLLYRSRCSIGQARLLLRCLT